MPLLLLFTGGSLGAWFGFKAGDTANNLKTYTFWGVVVLLIGWVIWKRFK